jgi:hypothetical protein
MDKFKRFMYGRYGGDSLSRALLVLSFILLIITSFLPKKLFWLTLVAYIPAVVCIFRIFSRNTFKRQRENYKYVKVKNHVLYILRSKSARAKDLKTHKYFKCKNCKQTLRVPRRQGKITITCPKCKNSFRGKS